LKQVIESMLRHQGVADGYIHHLARNPERVDSLLMWVVCTAFCWIVIMLYRREIIKGLEGKNLLFEAAEIVTFVTVLCLPPTLFYILLFKGTEPNQKFALLFEGGLIAVCLYGRYIFDWALAYKAGLDHVNVTRAEEDKDSVREVVREVKEEIKK